MKEEILKEFDVTNWLRSVYGLGDDDTLNAGEVEELLHTYENTRVSKAIDKAEQRGREEVIEKVEDRLSRYRCGKHWLLFKLLSKLKPKNE